MSGGERTSGRVEAVIGRLLRAGVLGAAVVVLAGAAVYLGRHGTAHPHYGVFHGEPSDLRTVRGILRDARVLSGRGIIQLGLLLLVATPIARVLFCLVAFAVERDGAYVVLTASVLLLLLYSLLWSG